MPGSPKHERHVFFFVFIFEAKGKVARWFILSLLSALGARVRSLQLNSDVSFLIRETRLFVELLLFLSHSA